MQIIQDYVPSTQVKSRLLDMVRSLHQTDNAIAITKNGVPEAVLRMPSMSVGSIWLRFCDVLSGQVLANRCRGFVRFSP